jgi:superfamily I DNA/RNA helicase
LDLKTNDVIELKKNWRNPYPVARLARHFYTDDPASPPPEMPSIWRRARTPLLFAYRVNQFSEIIRRILRRADRDVWRLIGVITPNNEVRQRYVEAFKKVDVRLDYGRPPIQTYQSGDKVELNFARGGIVVINMQSCKGLEFDDVFLADINRFYKQESDPDEIKRRFYVMTARARGMLVMLREAGKHCPACDILPEETDILERYGEENES